MICSAVCLFVWLYADIIGEIEDVFLFVFEGLVCKILLGNFVSVGYWDYIVFKGIVGWKLISLVVFVPKNVPQSHDH